MSEKTIPIEDLTKMVMFSGRISSVHLDNLKAYPWIFFNDLVEAKLDYLIETTDKTKPTVFSYDLMLKLESNDQIEKRYAALESAVRKLFWKEAKIEVKINGQEVYKSE